MIRLDEKARENLEAAERLLMRSDDGDVDPLSNAAASRAYYAAYLAVSDRAQREHLSFDSRRIVTIATTRCRTAHANGGILDEDGCDDLTRLRGLRVKADYFEDQVDYDEASDAAATAQQLVTALLKENT